MIVCLFRRVSQSPFRIAARAQDMTPRDNHQVAAAAAAGDTLRNRAAAVEQMLEPELAADSAVAAADIAVVAVVVPDILEEREPRSVPHR